MYSQNHAAMAPPQKPETFMLSNEAQQSLPQDAQVALQQVDNCEYTLIRSLVLLRSSLRFAIALSCKFSTECNATDTFLIVKYFLISAPVDWTPDQYIRRFLLPTGEYVSCVLW